MCYNLGTNELRWKSGCKNSDPKEWLTLKFVSEKNLRSTFYIKGTEAGKKIAKEIAETRKKEEEKRIAENKKKAEETRIAEEKAAEEKRIAEEKAREADYERLESKHRRKCKKRFTNPNGFEIGTPEY